MLWMMLNIPAALFLAEDVAGLIVLMTAPGHRIRSGSVGGTFSIPGYENWTAANKITEGITATAANIYFLAGAGIYDTMCFIADCSNRNAGKES